MPVIATIRDAASDLRIAITPAVAAQLVQAGNEVVVQKGAGVAAGFDDDAFAAAGAQVASAAVAVARADVLVAVGRPSPDVLAALKAGQHLVAELDAAANADALERAAAKGVVLIALEKVPRHGDRARAMDALSSQASIAGYRSVIVAVEAYGRCFPTMTTAAGTAGPATVLVLGAGVAGLRAMATALMLGASVTGYDVRRAAREDVTALGAQFLSTSVAGVGCGARALTPGEAAAQQGELSKAVAGFDVVIAAARVPGGAPPLLVPAAAVRRMRRGSIIVDLAASDGGGNVEGSRDGERVVTDNGALVIGAGAIAAEMAPAASDAFARNVQAVLSALIVNGRVGVDPRDDVMGAMLIAVNRSTAATPWAPRG